MDPPPSSLRVDLDSDLDEWELLLPSSSAESHHQQPSQTQTQTTTNTKIRTATPAEKALQTSNGFEAVAVVGLGGSASGCVPQTCQQLHHHKDGDLGCFLGAVVMPGWKDDYLSALLEAERDNPINLELVDACTQLNDRIALLEAERAQAAHQLHRTATSSSSSAALDKSQQSQQPPSTQATLITQDPSSTLAATASTTDPLTLRLRADLAHALRQNTDLTTRLRTAAADRDRLLAQTKSQAKSLATLTAERESLARRVRDQAEELRGKKQLYDQVQDEVIALEMQLNIAEQQKTQIAAENKNLIDRWMKRAELEASQMNALNEKKT
ncbi:autophagy protein 16-domain-containing protein [Coniella lustricola]|uniref:Autophagy protein 16-domain-containing protein n=1 Tax=Coniella lustricola TaxID=2025994 RepID=A0A2T3AK90_9PEZI|nr:autophagy protein 16-domain-containing protein [Coniella lustricola]